MSGSAKLLKSISVFAVTILLFSMVFGVLVLEVSAGSTYYVSTAGNDNNPGSSALPWRTIQKACNTVSPGDTVIVRSGTYSVSQNTLSRSGSSSSWITLKSEIKHGAKVIAGADYNDGFEITGSYITIDGFDISTASTGKGHGIEVLNGHHIKIINNSIHDCGGSGIQTNGGDYFTIEGNTVRNNAYNNPYQCSGISIYEPVAFDSNSGWHIILRGNMSYANENKVGRPSDGQLTDGNGIIIDDFKHSQNAPNINYIYDTLVENNLCFDNGGRGLYVMSANSKVVFRNNTSYKNSRILGVGELVVHDSAGDIQFINNIAWALSNRNAIADDGAWGNNSNITWKNNLTFNGTPGSSSILLNRTSTTLPAIQSNGNLLGQNPLLVNASADPAACNFRLQPASPAKNAGTSANGIPSVDFEGVPRPQGTAVDIGAYEYAETPGTPTPTPTPTPPSATPTPAPGYTDVWSTTSGDGGADTCSFTAVSGRYIRLYCSARQSIYWGFQVREIQVYNGGGNLALNKAATASNEAKGAAANAVDGLDYTRWGTVESEPQWIEIDLGNVYNGINSAVVKWDGQYARGYKLQVR